MLLFSGGRSVNQLLVFYRDIRLKIMKLYLVLDTWMKRFVLFGFKC